MFGQTTSDGVALQTAEVRLKGRANVIHHDQNKAPRRVATVIMCVRRNNVCRTYMCGFSSSSMRATGTIRHGIHAAWNGA